MSHKNNNNKLIGLEDLLKFQSLLAELSAKLIRVSPDMVDHEIQEGLCRIAENLDLDSVSIGLLTADGQDFYSRYQYSKTSVKAWQDASLMAEGPLLTQTILAGKPFIMHDVDKLPPEGAVDRESFLRYGIRANLAFPFMFPFIVGGACVVASALLRPTRASGTMTWCEALDLCPMDLPMFWNANMPYKPSNPERSKCAWPPTLLTSAFGFGIFGRIRSG